MSNYRKITKNLQRIIINNPKTEKEQLIWLNVNDTSKKEIEYLRKHFQFELKHLHASLARTVAQRPIVEQRQDYLFIILHFPVINNGRIVPAEIEFFLGHGFLVTIHNGDCQALNSFFNLCKKDGKSLLTYEFESSAVLLYEILDKLIQESFSILDQNSIEISNVEKIIFNEYELKAVSQILLLRRNIVNIRKIMQNHKNILKKLLSLKTPLIPEDLIKNHYFELIEHTKRIWEILENQREMIEIYYDTHESLVNDRMSDIMKTLTIFSVIVFPLTLLAAIFGMNTIHSMPFMDNKYGFWYVITIMLCGSFMMLMFFKKKKWL